MGPIFLAWALLIAPAGDARIDELEPSFIGLPTAPVPAVFEIEPTGRVLRGDWEAPDEVAVVFTRSWPQVSRRLAEAISATTDVVVIHEDDTSFREMRQWWRTLVPAARDRVRLLDVQVNSPWVRDYGPFQSRERDHSPVWIDAEYDDRRTRDDSFPSFLGERRPPQVEDYSDWIEGGAFISNGEGLCAATVEYFDLRGPSLADPSAVADLQRTLGCRVLALFPSLDTEPTNHADMLAQFLSPTRVLVATSTRNDSDARALAEVEATLQRAAASLGTSLEFVRVPARYSPYGGFRSYVNGLQIAGRFVMPEYGGGDAIDRAARAAFEAGTPGIEVVPINVKLPAGSGGAVHCLTLGLDAPPRR